MNKNDKNFQIEMLEMASEMCTKAQRDANTPFLDMMFSLLGKYEHGRYAVAHQQAEKLLTYYLTNCLEVMDIYESDVSIPFGIARAFRGLSCGMVNLMRYFGDNEDADELESITDRIASAYEAFAEALGDFIDAMEEECEDEDDEEDEDPFDALNCEYDEEDDPCHCCCCEDDGSEEDDSEDDLPGCLSCTEECGTCKQCCCDKDAETSASKENNDTEKAENTAKESEQCDDKYIEDAVKLFKQIFGFTPPEHEEPKAKEPPKQDNLKQKEPEIHTFVKPKRIVYREVLPGLWGFIEI